MKEEKMPRIGWLMPLELYLNRFGKKQMKKLAKENLSLAGEYAVASELCKRGIYAQLTLGYHKRTDILVVTEIKMVRIQVRTKQDNEWPSIQGPQYENEILVLVDFQNKSETDRADFYILDCTDWKNVIQNTIKKRQNMWKKHPKILQNGKIEWTDGLKGLNPTVNDVYIYREKWEKIEEKLSNVSKNPYRIKQ